MEKIQMVTSKRVEGEVEYNDGQSAEVRTIGIEGIEEGLWLDTIQIHREDTQGTREEFRQRFPVGMELWILTITEIEEKSASLLSILRPLRAHALAFY
jgi:hypothetical protein